MDQELSVTSTQPRFQLGFFHSADEWYQTLAQLPLCDVFDVDTCTEASDTINLFEGKRLSNLVLGSCSAVGFFALLLAVLVTSLERGRRRL